MFDQKNETDRLGREGVIVDTRRESPGTRRSSPTCSSTWRRTHSTPGHLCSPGASACRCPWPINVANKTTWMHANMYLRMLSM